MDDRKKLIERFFRDGVLFCMPTKLIKRQTVLEEIVKTIDSSRDYTEKEINEILVKIYDDYCTLRRYLVDEGLLKRENGIYSIPKTN